MDVTRLARSLRDLRSPAVFHIRRGVRHAIREVGHPGRVLDVGAGRVVWRGQFGPDQEYLAFDVRPHAALDFVASATAIPLRDETVDLVLCTEVLEHVDDTQSVLREIHRVLRPGGQLILSIPFLWGVHDWTDYYRWTPAGIEGRLAAEGFSIETMRHRGGIFSTLAALIDQIPFQLLSGDPRRLGDMGGTARVRFLSASVIQLLMTPFIWAVASFDVFDRPQRFTLGLVVIARRSDTSPAAATLSPGFAEYAPSPSPRPVEIESREVWKSSRGC